MTSTVKRHLQTTTKFRNDNSHNEMILTKNNMK